MPDLKLAGSPYGYVWTGVNENYLRLVPRALRDSIRQRATEFAQGKFYIPRGLAAFNLAPFYSVVLNPEVGLDWAREWLDAVAPDQPLPRGTVAEPITLGGRPAERITVGATVRPRAVLYLHGGGFVLGSLHTHRSLAAHLARDAGAVVFLLDYRLAPEHPYPAALDDAVAAFKDIVDNHGFEPEQVGISGDSAGGGLATAATRALIDEHGIKPGALALLSPLTDPKDESMPAGRDWMVSRDWLHRSADKYLGGADATSPGFAPIYAQLMGLPATLVHVGMDEILLPQVRRFVDKASAAGVDVTYEELRNFWHAGHLQVGVVREAADAVQSVGTFLRTRLDEAAAIAANRALALAAEAKEQASHALNKTSVR